MKRKTAKEILAESFREIAGKKSIDKITVIEITENCGYSATTFYRHFKDKYDLIAWEYLYRYEEVMKRIVGEKYDWEKACLGAAMFFQDQKEYLKSLLRHTKGLDSFARNMKSIHFDYACRWLLNAVGAEKLDIKTEMYLSSYCDGSVDLTCDWIMGRYDVSPEEMGEIYMKSLPVPLYEFAAAKNR